MPIYEYECQLKHGTFEHTQSMNSPALEKCPKCEEEGLTSEKPKRLISLSSFSLVGGGWANEGYK